MVKIFDVEVDSDDVEQAMARATRWLDDYSLSPFVRDTFGSIMRDTARTRFSTESSNGVAWEPLKGTTIRRREALGFPGAHPINVRTGQMESHVIHSVPEGGATPEGVEYKWPETAQGELFLKMARAAGWDKRAPARPVVDLDEGDMDKFIDEAFMSLEAAVR